MRMWEKGDLHALWVVIQIATATMENIMEFPQKLKIDLPYDPAILLLVIYLKKSKTLIWKDMCIPIVAALFTTAKIRKQLKCPYIHNGILFGHKKE